jgi:UDP-N-acetylmuramate dehydrogenase
MSNFKIQKTLRGIAGDRVRFHCSMAPYTTFKTGGEVAALWEVLGIEELLTGVPLLRRAKIPYFVLGCGSNLLIRDGGVEGVAIRLGGSLARMEEDSRGELNLKAGAGLSLSDLLAVCRQKGYGGLEFLAGIPGSIGGAAVMNAGAFGMDMASVIHCIEMVSPGGELVEKEIQELSFDYRKLYLETGTIVSRVLLSLERRTPHEVAQRMAEYLKKRKETQPLEYPSAGSIFKNPPGGHAGRLIESTGLKGAKEGGAMISTKHANWIVNTGGAKAQDILTLVELARKEVRARTGVELELELKVLGQ